MTFYEKLRSIQEKNESLLCIGLDPDIRRIPGSLRASANPVLEFNRRIIEATADLVCAYKLNLAFYESYGEAGWRTIQATLALIPPEIVSIGDGKRGDVGNSSDAYAQALFQTHNFSACTVSPYMGEDSVTPFLRDEERGAFLLALTSNPGARDFQYLRVRGKPLYEHVIAKAKKWNRRGNCGLVVGATRPRELKKIRALAPGMPQLIPGVGSQGGDLKTAVRSGCDRSGYMAIINSSRVIIYASAENDFATAARGAAIALQEDINRYR